MSLFTGLIDDHEWCLRAAWNNVPRRPGLLASEDLKVDCDGRPIRWSEYGQYSDCGWCIERVVAPAPGDADVPWNLRARHWRAAAVTAADGGLLTPLFEARI